MTAQHELSQAATLHAARGRARAEARSLSYRALAAFRAGETRDAASTFRAAMVRAEAACAPDLIANTGLNLATVEHQLGELGSALAAYERAADMARIAEAAAVETTIEANAVKLFVDVGVLTRASQLVDGIELRARQLGLSLVATTMLALRGEIALLEGRSAEALDHFATARAAFEESGAIREVAEVSAQMSAAYLAQRDVVHAKELARAALSRSELAATDVVARGKLALGECLLAEGKATDGVVALDEARERARVSGQALLCAEIEQALGRGYEACGTPALAARAYAAAREVYERAALLLTPIQREAFWAHPLRRGLRDRSASPTHAVTTERAGRAERFEKLVAINRKLSASLDVADILRTAIDSAVDLLGAERGFVILRSSMSADPALSAPVARNIAEGQPEDGWEFSRTIAERVVRSGEAVVTVDARTDERFGHAVSVHGLSLTSIVCVPIRSGALVLGALYLERTGRARRIACGLSKPNARYAKFVKDNSTVNGTPTDLAISVWNRTTTRPERHLVPVDRNELLEYILTMQLHFYLPDPIAEELRRRAEAKGTSLSKYVAELVQREVQTGWPEDYFRTVVGGWSGEPLARPPQGDLEVRDHL